jgi:hypothetical protein
LTQVVSSTDFTCDSTILQARVPTAQMVACMANENHAILLSMLNHWHWSGAKAAAQKPQMERHEK